MSACRAKFLSYYCEHDLRLPHMCSFLIACHCGELPRDEVQTHTSDIEVPYFRDQTPPSISSRPRIIAVPPEVLNEIVAALE